MKSCVALRKTDRREAGTGYKLEIEVKGPAIKHEVTLATVRKWADGTCKSPAEIMMKKRVRAMLEGC